MQEEVYTHPGTPYPGTPPSCTTVTPHVHLLSHRMQQQEQYTGQGSVSPEGRGGLSGPGSVFPEEQEVSLGPVPSSLGGGGLSGPGSVFPEASQKKESCVILRVLLVQSRTVFLPYSS